MDMDMDMDTEQVIKQEIKSYFNNHIYSNQEEIGQIETHLSHLYKKII